MKNRKRVLSVLLALAVVFTMCITAAVAVDTGSGSTAFPDWWERTGR